MRTIAELLNLDGRVYVYVPRKHQKAILEECTKRRLYVCRQSEADKAPSLR